MTIRKLSLLSAVAALAAGSLSAPAQSTDMKVGIVDMKRVFQEYFKTKDAEKKVNEDKSKAKKDLDDRCSDLAGVATHPLGGRQGAVALEIGQVWTVGGRGAGQVDGQTKGTERPGEALVDRASQPAHFWARPPAVTVWVPASRRNRFPSRLKAAMAGVTSKPTRTSKLEPEVVRVARGMTMPSIRSTA